MSISTAAQASAIWSGSLGSCSGVGSGRRMGQSCFVQQIWLARLTKSSLELPGIRRLHSACASGYCDVRVVSNLSGIDNAESTIRPIGSTTRLSTYRFPALIWKHGESARTAVPRFPTRLTDRNVAWIGNFSKSNTNRSRSKTQISILIAASGRGDESISNAQWCKSLDRLSSNLTMIFIRSIAIRYGYGNNGGRTNDF